MEANEITKAATTPEDAERVGRWKQLGEAAGAWESSKSRLHFLSLELQRIQSEIGWATMQMATRQERLEALERSVGVTAQKEV